MPLNDPSEWYFRAAEAKNRNRRQAMQDAMGIGENINQGFNTIAQQMQEKKKKDQWQQTISQLMQNPNLPPNMKAMLPVMSQHPELLGQLGPELMKPPPQPKPEWSPVSGMLTPEGQPIEIDRFSGKMQPGGLKAQSTGFGSQMGPIRKAQFTLQDLPSNQGPSTAGGAAYQVKIGARQGMNLIARPGSAQRTAAAAADLVRSITRVAPTDEGLKNANFSDNLVSRWSMLKQKMTADPTVVNNPEIRKEMYSIFKEMDQSATPFIQNQLDDMSDAGFPVTPATRKRQLGMMLPDIPFDSGTSTGTAKGGSGWSYVGTAQ